MKKRWISLVLALCMVLSMIPAIAFRAHAAETWYAPVVRQLTELYDYTSRNQQEKQTCRGALHDFDKDGFEELILVWQERYNGLCHYQLWDMVDGVVTNILDEEINASYGGLAVFFLNLDGTDYMAIESSSSGSIGTYYSWTLLDPMEGYAKKYNFSYDYNTFTDGYAGGGNYSPVPPAWEAQLTQGLVNTQPLAGNSYFHRDYTGRTFADLSTAEVYTRLVAYTQDQDMTILEGSEISIRYVLYESDKIVTDWAKPVVSISNGAVAEAVSWEKVSDGYLLKVRGLIPGSASITVTDGDSKAFVIIPLIVRDSDLAPLSYFINQVPSGYPSWFGDRKTQTNFYDVNGLSVNQYKCSSLQNGYYTVSFNVYNSTPMFGSVDVYDKDGKWIHSQRIDKFQRASSLYDVAEDTWFLVKDLVALNALSYTSVARSQETKISLKVPDGGHLVISNNCMQSPGAYIYNTADLSMYSISTLADLLFDDSHLEQIHKQVIDTLMGDDILLEAFLREFRKISLDALATVTYDSIADTTASITEQALNLYDLVNLDFRGIVSSVCNISEDLFLTFTMAEVSLALKGMFAINEYIDLIFQVRGICSSFDNTGIILTSASANCETVTVNGIKATPDGYSVLPANAILEVFRIADQSILTAPSLGVNTDNFLLYNICYTVNNEQIQPNGSVIVQIPVPPGFDASRCVILHENENGEWEQIPSRLENGFLVFSADHFSLFALVETVKANPFTDVQLGQWYTDPVLWAVENGITTGATATTFNPNGTCLRAQVVTFLWRAAGCPAPGTAVNPFVDVKPSDFYYDAVLWAVENGITNGADATHFNPMGVCNRAQVVTFLHRVFEEPAVEGVENPFTDVPAGTWYTAPVLWAVKNGITNGLSATEFGPNASCNRAQIVTFLYRAYTN